MSIRPTTPGQTVGPFFHYALPYPQDSELVPSASPSAVRLHGRVLDGAGQPVPDALVEIWQTDTRGNVPRVAGSLRRDGWTFTGFGRSATDNEGQYSFSTLAPGSGFFSMTVFARGLLNRLFTRAYLPGHNPTNTLRGIDPDRANTMLVTHDELGFVFDICLQGKDETVFLDYSTNRTDAASASEAR